jgi:hypothetical protein
VNPLHRISFINDIYLQYLNIWRTTSVACTTLPKALAHLGKLNCCAGGLTWLRVIIQGLVAARRDALTTSMPEPAPTMLPTASSLIKELNLPGQLGNPDASLATEPRLHPKLLPFLKLHGTDK